MLGKPSILGPGNNPLALSGGMRKFFASLVVAILSVSVSAFPSVAVTTDFISTWKTDNLTDGSSAARQIRLPLVSSGTYNFLVNWGDGASTTVTSYDDLDATHTYTVAGTYTLTINGLFNGFAFSNAGDKGKLLIVSQWGSLALGDTDGFFQGAFNFNSTATDVPDLTQTTSLASAFAGATSFNGPIANWDVSGVTSLASTFEGATSFNQPIGGWNVSNVENLRAAFYGATNFNQPLAGWNVSKVWHFGIAFETASSFNQDLSSWDVTGSSRSDQQEIALDGFLSNTDLSPLNYGRLLIGWSALEGLETMSINSAGRHAPNEFGTSAKYNSTDAAVLAARYSLVERGWIIRDGGPQIISTVGESKTMSISYFHEGDPQTFDRAEVGGRNARDFKVLASDCFRLLHDADSCITQVTWSPLGEGEGIAELRFFTSESALAAPNTPRMDFDSTGDCASKGFEGGTGTEAEPYLIATTAQFNCINGFSDHYLFLRSHFKLTQDLDFGGEPLAFQEIGNENAGFSGTLDGDNHTISGIVDSSEFSALIPYFWNGVVKNLELLEPQFDSDYDAGAITVYGENVRIENVHVDGGQVTSRFGGYVGGIAGNAYEGSEIVQASTSASIVVWNGLAASMVGGLVGWVEPNTSIRESSSDGSVSYKDNPLSETVRLGGLVGWLESSEISDSYSTGLVNIDSGTSNLFVGALVGDMYGGTISRTFATGAVTGATAAGFAGRYIDSPVVADSFWDRESTGLTTDVASSPIAGGGRTTAQLKTFSNYVTWGNNITAGGSSEGTWTLEAESYPQLSFEIARVSARAAVEAAARAAAAQAQQSPVLAPQTTLQAKGKRITPNKTSKIEVEGGSGQGAVKFRSLDEGVCKVDEAGVITGVSPGKCVVEVVKVADSIFAASTTMASVQILTPYEKLRFAPNEIKADEIKSIRGRYLSYLRADLFGQLSVSALSALSKAQIKVITKKQMAALSPQQRMALKR